MCDYKSRHPKVLFWTTTQCSVKMNWLNQAQFLFCPAALNIPVHVTLFCTTLCRIWNPRICVMLVQWVAHSPLNIVWLKNHRWCQSVHLWGFLPRNFLFQSSCSCTNLKGSAWCSLHLGGSQSLLIRAWMAGQGEQRAASAGDKEEYISLSLHMSMINEKKKMRMANESKSCWQMYLKTNGEAAYRQRLK